jgi:hypothetical protein
MRLLKRKIRERIRDILIEAGTPAGIKVAIGRTIPTWIEDFPVILIYPSNENVQRFNEAPKNYQRNFALDIECLAKGSDDDELDYNLEVLAERVEDIVEIDETFGGIADRTELTNTEYQTEPDGQSPVGALKLTYNVRYYQDANQPGLNCLDDLKRVDTDWQVGHDGGSPEDNVVDAEDQVNFD